QYRHNLFDRKALAFHGKPPPGSGSSLPQNSLSDWPRIPNADQSRYRAQFATGWARDSGWRMADLARGERL
ncbi:hypothetical protein, partial [Burkholderia gladioli]|uniref:hypothetical protein n=1 Tax=Burkholderia gladioli TaxID=28095 RepID=UPI0026526952